MNLPSAEELLRSMEISDVYEVADRTRLTAARRLSGIAGRPVWLKREDEQPVHSFKLRGAYQLMSSLDRARLDRGVVAASAGNHAQGVAVSASRLGCRATIVVPRTAPTIKQEAIRSLGAELLVEGDNFDEAKEVALALAAANRAVGRRPQA
ncbi:MAG: pyridoxal-phosphate dependent enzyme, partial [Fimbriimonadaceae bacterium]|nr:pyridoxal-phosphate dependent enzyme [Fimbriimonadaceae bacterium]